MQDWETMIAERVAAHGVVVTCREQDPQRRNRQAYDRRHDKTPKRIAQHKAWALSPAGKKSMRERGARYRATENGKEHCRKKSRNYFLRHCNDPAWRAHRLEVQKEWKARRKAAKILAGVPFETTITLQDIGTITVHIYKGVAA